MCIFTPPIVEKVSKTKIFVAPLPSKRQLTVYSNNVQIDNPVAMVLPFPSKNVGKYGGCRLINLEDYKDIFDDLDLIFGPKHSFEGARSYGISTNSSLEVFQIGSYKVSIVPSLTHLYRLQFNVFNLTPDVGKVLKQNYPKGFGFVVCIIDKTGEFHPLAYTHSLLNNAKLFIPTRHLHSHSSKEIDWDHEIYMFNSRINLNRDRSQIKIKERKFTSTENANEFGIKRLCRLIRKLPIDFPILTNLIKLTIDPRWNYNHDLFIPTNYTTKTKNLHIALDGSKFINKSNLNCQYYNYGFRVFPIINKKFLSINGFRKDHFGNNNYTYYQKDNKYYVIIQSPTRSIVYQLVTSDINPNLICLKIEEI